MIWTNVPTTCPRCEFPVSYHVHLDSDLSIKLIPAGQDPETHVWLAYRRDLKELVQDIYWWLLRNFPQGGEKSQIVDEISQSFGLIPKHVEQILEIMRNEGVIVFPSEQRVEVV